ncbi:MAG: leucine-rich repeat domain-containing protein, partial [Dehalococcoidia bacterium]|nr:leucine-rich repeat domain-containing protein [Dehalococcoidia bacterium]
ISPLSNLTSLTHLALWENQINDISPLSNLATLTYLTLNYNEISDISPLANLVNLQLIALSGNQISDISTLLDLSSLSSENALDLRYNPLSATSVDTYIPLLEQRGLNVIWDPPPAPTTPTPTLTPSEE